MPSFFYHLALDLDTKPTHYLEPPPNLWEAFKIIRSSGSSRSGYAGELSPPRNATSKDQKQGESSVTNQHPETVLEKTASISGSQEKSDAVSSEVRDWRYGRILSQGIKMAPVDKDTASQTTPNRTSLIGHGLSAGPGALATKARFEPTISEEDEIGWGVVRLYRDGQETPGLYDEPRSNKNLRSGRAAQRRDNVEHEASRDEDCTTLCILAVPSYLTPSDFLGFVGEKTRDEVSHFRMIRTERSNRYMVLMKFRGGKEAREWRREWNGKAFDGIEPETAHVVFVSSITFLAPSSSSSQPTSYPTMTDDPFTPTQPPTSSRTTTSKPLAPPTPALIELPTCPVCLERMDESTGLLTILCQHVFHCACLQKWRGSGCPVCRYTQNDPSKRSLHSLTSAEAEAARPLNECNVCRSEANLWICLICGSVGCGRYDAAHAFSHYNDNGHAFALDMQTQRVWDYSSDCYVHRLVQNAHDGKLVDLSTPEHGAGVEYEDAEDDYDDFVPRSKLHNAGVEYTTLLTSQLDSQRMYFEGILERAADKASLASQSAEKSATSAERAQQQLEGLQEEHGELVRRIVPDLQKEKTRAEKRAGKFETMARKWEKEWQEEKTVAGSLMERIQHLDQEVEKLGQEKGALSGEKAELEETVRDLMFNLTGSQKISEMQETEGGGEIQGASVSLPERPEIEGEKGKKKKKGKK